jgi:hypothetical protein
MRIGRWLGVPVASLVLLLGSGDALADPVRYVIPAPGVV